MITLPDQSEVPEFVASSKCGCQSDTMVPYSTHDLWCPMDGTRNYAAYRPLNVPEEKYQTWLAECAAAEDRWLAARPTL